MSSKISGILNRNYYTIAHDLNPSENKEEKKPDAAGDQNSDNENSENVQNQKEESEEEIEDDPDEADHLEKGGGKLEITVENPEKTQVRWIFLTENSIDEFFFQTSFNFIFKDLYEVKKF